MILLDGDPVYRRHENGAYNGRFEIYLPLPQWHRVAQGLMDEWTRRSVRRD